MCEEPVFRTVDLTTKPSIISPSQEPDWETSEVKERTSSRVFRVTYLVGMNPNSSAKDET